MDKTAAEYMQKRIETQGVRGYEPLLGGTFWESKSLAGEQRKRKRHVLTKDTFSTIAGWCDVPCPLEGTRTVTNGILRDILANHGVCCGRWLPTTLAERRKLVAMTDHDAVGDYMRVYNVLYSCRTVELALSFLNVRDEWGIDTLTVDLLLYDRAVSATCLFVGQPSAFVIVAPCEDNGDGHWDPAQCWP
jgi:hypothetical protein